MSIVPAYDTCSLAVRSCSRWLGTIAWMLLFLSLAPSLSAVPLTVGSGQTYATIGQAYSDADGGDIIEVYDGTYTDIVTVAKSNLIVRAAPGNAPAVSPDSASATAFAVSATNVTVEGFEITGTNVIFGINVLAAGTDARILKNSIHDISTNVASVTAISAASSGALISSNHISNLGIGAAGPLCKGISVSGSKCVVENNIIEEVNLQGASGNDYILYITGPNCVIQGNTIQKVMANSGATYNTCVKVTAPCTNTTVQNNTIFGRYTGTNIYSGANSMEGIGLPTANWNIINANRLFDCRVTFRGGFGSAVSNIYANNAVFDTALYGVYSSQLNTFSNNAMVQGAQYVIYLESASATTNTFVGNALLVYAATPRSGFRNDNGPNLFADNFFSSPQTDGGTTNGLASPPPVEVPHVSAVTFTNWDNTAATGFWARALIPGNTASTEVANVLSTNMLGQTTKLVYDTTADPTQMATSGVGALVFDVATNRHPATAGLFHDGRWLVNLGRTLQVAHRFLDGAVLMGIRLAYDKSRLPDSINFRKETTLDLYWFDVRDYTNQYWQLAVQGNVINSAFPSNDIRRIVGPPDTVLGHYGVDTANNVVWANVNYMGDFGAFQNVQNAGTIFSTR